MSKTRYILPNKTELHRSQWQPEISSLHVQLQNLFHSSQNSLIQLLMERLLLLILLCMIDRGVTFHCCNTNLIPGLKLYFYTEIHTIIFGELNTHSWAAFTLQPKLNHQIFSHSSVLQEWFDIEKSMFYRFMQTSLFKDTDFCSCDASRFWEAPAH